MRERRFGRELPEKKKGRGKKKTEGESPDSPQGSVKNGKQL